MATKVIRIHQCYFCPYWLAGTSTKFEDQGWCKREKKSLYNTLKETDKDIFIQTIPDWCPLEDLGGLDELMAELERYENSPPTWAELSNLQDDKEKAESQLAELREDQLRLQFLARRVYFPEDHPKSGVFVCVGEEIVEFWPIDVGENDDLKSLRIAIDKINKK